MKPLAVDLFCGLGGWTEGLLAEGYDVIGFDIERHQYGDHKYPAQLVIQDVLTLHGSQFKDAALIVASPPCQAYSYRAMPWKQAKAQKPRVLPDWWFKSQKEMDHHERDAWGAWQREHPVNPPDVSLFDACFRIQREACEAAGRHVPLIVENVRGAQKWVGRARWNFGSFYLWGDVPALMPPRLCEQKFNPDGTRHGTGSWFAVADSKNRGTKQRGSGHAWFDKALDERRKHPEGVKNPGCDLTDIGFNVASAHQFGHMVEGVKIERDAEMRRQHLGTKRKFASAMIAKIPLPLSRHIAAVYRP